MHLILPPLLTLPRPAALLRRLTGRPAVDLRPWKGATEVADEAVMVGAIVLEGRRRQATLAAPMPGHQGIYNHVLNPYKIWKEWLLFACCLVSLSLRISGTFEAVGCIPAEES